MESTETKYPMGVLVETTKGSVARIAGIRIETNHEQDKPTYTTISYRLVSFTGARGFYVPEGDITRVIE